VISNTRSGVRGRGLCVAAAGLFVALATVGCGLGVFDNFAPLRPTDNFHVIEEGKAYRSAQLDASTLRLVVEALGIRTVVNLRGENEGEKWYDNEKAALDELGVTLVDIRMSARELPARAELLKLYDTFVGAEGPILIHCRGGADRTGAAAAIWRMVVMGEDKRTAARELCVCYGHFELATPEMDELVEMFQPSREWIENEYPVP